MSNRDKHDHSYGEPHQAHKADKQHRQTVGEIEDSRSDAEWRQEVPHSASPPSLL